MCKNTSSLSPVPWDRIYNNIHYIKFIYTFKHSKLSKSAAICFFESNSIFFKFALPDLFRIS